jgi:hypothetical protein
MRLFFFLTLLSLFLFGCETTNNPPSPHHAAGQRTAPLPTPSSQQNTNPNVTAAKMISPMM